MHAKVYSAQVSGLQADIITIEVDIAKGLHSFSIVGLPDKAVGEAKDRINAAIKNSGFSWNGTSRRYEKKISGGQTLVRNKDGSVTLVKAK